MSSISEIRLALQTDPNHDQEIHKDNVVPINTAVDCKALHHAVSLIPGEDLILGCVLGDEECRVVRDSWRVSLPVVVLSAVEFDKIANRNHVVFTARNGDLKEGK